MDLDAIVRRDGEDFAIAMRMAFARALEEAGLLSLHELCSSVTGPIDPVGGVCALACRGELEIDLTDGLTPTTIVGGRL